MKTLNVWESGGSIFFFLIRQSFIRYEKLFYYLIPNVESSEYSEEIYLLKMALLFTYTKIPKVRLHKIEYNILHFDINIIFRNDVHVIFLHLS